VPKRFRRRFAGRISVPFGSQRTPCRGRKERAVERVGQGFYPETGFTHEALADGAGLEGKHKDRLSLRSIEFLDAGEYRSVEAAGETQKSFVGFARPERGALFRVCGNILRDEKLDARPDCGVVKMSSLFECRPRRDAKVGELDADP